MPTKLFEENNELIPHSCLLKLQSVYDTLKSAERKAADLLLKSPGFISNATIGEAADKAGCSQATFVRLAHRLGYEGYPELKSQLKSRGTDNPSQLYEQVGLDDTNETIVRKVFQACIQTLADTLNVFNISTYSQAVDALCRAQRIQFCGIGDSYPIALAAQQKFMRAGIDALYFADTNAQLVAASHMGKGDVLVAVSHLGRSKSVLELVKYARTNGVTVISITNYPVSPLSKNSDILLLTAAFAEHIRGEVISKRLAQLCIIECLFVNVLMKNRESLAPKVDKANSVLEISII